MTLERKSPHQAFKDQKHSAKQRGIEFLFSYEDWVSWWVFHLGPDWFQLRGPRKGQYCMARLRDEGPYVAWNVRCITGTENRRESIIYGTSSQGERSGKNRLTGRDVISIIKSSDKATVLAKHYSVSPLTIRRIRHGQTWKFVTRNIQQSR
jgi:hypothetical protein